VRVPAWKQAYSRPARASGGTTPSGVSPMSPPRLRRRWLRSLATVDGGQSAEGCRPKEQLTRPKWTFARHVTKARCARWQHLRLRGKQVACNKGSVPRRNFTAPIFFARGLATRSPIFSLVRRIQLARRYRQTAAVQAQYARVAWARAQHICPWSQFSRGRGE
jgi:hypothetical protein